MSIHAIAVDDNAGVLSLLDHYVAKTTQISLFNAFTSPLEALDYVSSNSVNIAFIDVNMPDISGLDFISVAKKRVNGSLPKFVLISAHKEYAVDGFDLEVADYLLKPFGLDRFLMTVDKVSVHGNHSPLASSVLEECVFARQGGKYVKIKPASVLYVESKGHFVYLHFPDDTPLILSENMTRMEALLSSYGFVRVHKQYLINRHHIREVDASSVVIDSTKDLLPIGRKYKGFISRLINC